MSFFKTWFNAACAGWKSTSLQHSFIRPLHFSSPAHFQDEATGQRLLAGCRAAKHLHRLSAATLLTCTLCVAWPSYAQAPLPAVSTATRALLKIGADSEKQLIPSSEQVAVVHSPDAAAPGLIVTIQPGKDEYPGVTLKPTGASWDLSAFGHVEARVTNLGSKPLPLTLRADGAGPWQNNPWNGNTTYIEPGKTDTAQTIFGYSWGRPGYPVKPEAITQILLFAAKSDVVQSFRIEFVQAAGPAGEKPPVDPASVRTKPAGGVLLGAGATIDARQITSSNAQTSLVGSALRVSLPAAANEQSVALKPAVGRWDLRDYLEVRVKVLNNGQAPVAPRVRVDSNGGPSDWVAAQAPLAPGTAREIVVPFIRAAVKDLSKPETLGRFTSDAVSGVTIATDKADGERALLVQSIKASMPPAPTLPAWLGKRPPVAGDWVKTLDDDFNGTALDTSVWSVSGENYWDKTSHWSKDNVLLGGGTVKLRYEKKTGFNNDDPTQKKSDYQSGYLHTYDRWAQRYGYFEARMKLPTAPGLWPAFWMMPDRGVAAGPEQWKRQSTSDGGMEFDIMEHLTRWGATRYNIAMHYDGYDKDHKHTGSDAVYVQPDKDGFITTGLLWTPGLAIYYANGQEVLRWENPRISSVPQMLMFTLPMGGWDNSPLDDAQLPNDFTIDYVRVWQRKDLASPSDGKIAPR